MLVENAVPVGPLQDSNNGNNSTADGESKRPRQRDQIVECADACELWHDAQKVAYATIPVNDHREHWRLSSSSFKRWVAARYYKSSGKAPTGQMLTDAFRVLEVKAINEGPCRSPFTRTGWDGKASWIDLCDERWRAVKVTGDGWEIVDTPLVRFVRSEVMHPLPTPEPGHMIEELRGFVNVDDDDLC